MYKFTSLIRRPYVSNIAVLLWCHHEHKYISQHKILNTDIKVKTQSKNSKLKETESDES